jgi:EmrB/QacA subfamily drug resistance transporter
LEAGRNRQLVTAALMLGMFLAALEATAVATAMPTAIGDLGGIARYSWVFSAYLLTSTTTVPLYGKLADIYGRRRIFYISVALFLAGSALSGAAGSMEQLILFRGIQGLGAGGVMPVATTLIGDIYTLEERGRMQGLLSGVWGVSSIIGPALGGLITDALSWRWVFYLNVPFAIGSVVMLQLFLHERIERREHKLDLIGTFTLTASLTLLLLAMLEGGPAWGWTSPVTLAMFAAAVVSFVLFIRQEQRAPEPVLPLDLFRNRVIAVASAGSVVIGTLLFATAAFVPMFTQGVLGGTALDAGITLAPMSIGWPIASTLSGWLLLRTGFRPLTIFGGAVSLIGAGMLATVDAESSRALVMASMFVAGVGLGFMSTPYLLAVQNAVSWGQRGVATSAVQFFRTVGGAVTVAGLGAVLNARLAASGVPADANAALDPALRAAMPAETLQALVTALTSGLESVDLVIAIIAGAGLLIALKFPRGKVTAHAYRGAEQGV